MNTPNGGDASTSTPRKKLPVKPSLEHLQKQAKRRIKLQPSLKLAEAQHQLAREYGCKNWGQLARMVETMLRGADQLAYVKMDFEPLAKAAREVDVHSVREILSTGEFTQHDLDQALARSLWYGEEEGWQARKEIADLLLEHGADPDGQYGSDYGPIVFGTGECLQPSGLQYLIDAGADVTFGRIQTKYGRVCLLDHVLGTYNRGRNERKHRMIEILLAHGAYVPPEVTPPLLAIHRGDAKALGALLDADPTLLRRTFADMPYGNISLRGASLLHCAVEFGEIACAEELFKRVADINIKAETIDGLGGQTPIFHAINTNSDSNFPMLEYLAKRVSPWMDMSVRATWTAYGEPQRTPMTPFEYAKSADTPESRKWRKHVDEELAIVGFLDGTEQLKQALLRKDEKVASRLLDERPDLMNPSLWPHAIFQAKSVEMTRLLLDRGLHPDECTAPRKPLHLAVYQCLPDIVELLIERGADVNLRNPLGETPLDLLDAYEPRPIGDPDALRIRRALLAAGAKDDLYTLIRAGEVKALRKMLKADPSLARADSDLGGPLFVASRSGRVEVVKLLLDHGADPNKVNSKGNTPLWFAAQSPARPASDRVAVMELLLGAGADIHKRCEDGTTALHFAAWRGPVEVVEYLLSRGARPWTTDDKDRTPKEHAVQMSNSPDKEEIVRLFSEVRILDPIFRSAVAALDAGDVEGLRTILRKHPGLVRQRAEEEGWFAGVYFRHPTLLHFAANNPYRHETMPPRILESTEAILDAGAEIDATTEIENDHTVLGLVTSCEPARKAGLQIPLIELLVRRGADPSRGLDPAVIHGEDEAVACLLRLGVTHTVMSSAALGDAVALKKLLKKKVSPHEKMDAALAAARYGKVDSVEALLESGLNINERMTSHPYGPTVLHQAAWFGRRELADWLITRGADLSIRDTQFEGTPAGWAQHGGHPELAAWLSAQEKPSVKSVLAALQQVAVEMAPELEKHQLLSLTGEWLNSSALKIQKAHWTDGAGHQTFFSVWADAKDLKKGRFKYNIHALKMRLLPGYRMSADDFASGFRERFTKAGGNWPNVKTDYGPQTLMEGWMPFDVKTFRDDVTGLVNGFIAIHGIIDDLLEELRIK
jgi:ankyrin repeat protein